MIHPENAVVAICAAYIAPTSQSLTTRILGHPGKKPLPPTEITGCDALLIRHVLTGTHFLDGYHACCEATDAGGVRFSADYPHHALKGSCGAFLPPVSRRETLKFYMVSKVRNRAPSSEIPLSKAGEIGVCKFVDRAKTIPWQRSDVFSCHEDAQQVVLRSC